MIRNYQMSQIKRPAAVNSLLVLNFFTESGGKLSCVQCQKKLGLENASKPTLTNLVHHLQGKDHEEQLRKHTGEVGTIQAEFSGAI